MECHTGTRWFGNLAQGALLPHRFCRCRWHHRHGRGLKLRASITNGAFSLLPLFNDLAGASCRLKSQHVWTASVFFQDPWLCILLELDLQQKKWPDLFSGIFLCLSCSTHILSVRAHCRHPKKNRCTLQITCTFHDELLLLSLLCECRTTTAVAGFGYASSQD